LFFELLDERNPLLVDLRVGSEELNRGVVLGIGHSDSVRACGWMGLVLAVAVEPAVHQGLRGDQEVGGSANGRGLSFAGGVEQAALGDVDEGVELVLAGTFRFGNVRAPRNRLRR
jgi:hypothetical protein